MIQIICKQTAKSAKSLFAAYGLLLKVSMPYGPYVTQDEHTAALTISTEVGLPAASLGFLGSSQHFEPAHTCLQAQGLTAAATGARASAAEASRRFAWQQAAGLLCQ